MTATATRPHGILYDHDPSLTRDSLRETYRVPTLDELVDTKQKALRGDSQPLRESLGNRWQPVHHADWIDAVRTAAGERDLIVTSEKFSLSKDRHDLHALFEFETDGEDIVDKVVRAFALRASNMQRHQSEGRTGGRVEICSNGILTGLFLLGHKQTTKLDPLELLREGFQKWETQQDDLAVKVAYMRNTKLPESTLFEIMGRAVLGVGDEKPILSGPTAKRVIGEYKKPRHECFAPRTRWSFYNAVTEALKHESRMSNDVAARVQLGMSKLIVPKDVKLN